MSVPGGAHPARRPGAEETAPAARRPAAVVPLRAGQPRESQPGEFPDPPGEEQAFPSLRTILGLPAFAAAELLCGHSRLDAPVTWVHISEVLDIGRFLSGSELILTVGLELARAGAAARRSFIHSLEQARARAIAFELVHWMQQLPEEILEAGSALEFPIIVFRTEVSFSRLTRTAHERILRPRYEGETEPAMEMLLHALIDTGRDRAFVRSELGALLRLPPRPRSILLGTLEAMLHADFNIAASARKLGVRRQSLYYRMDQLTALLGPLDNPARRLGLAVAFALLERSPQRRGSR